MGLGASDPRRQIAGDSCRVEGGSTGKPPPAEETTGVQADGEARALWGIPGVTPATQPIEDCACGFGNHEQDRFLADAAREPAGGKGGKRDGDPLGELLP